MPVEWSVTKANISVNADVRDQPSFGTVLINNTAMPVAGVSPLAAAGYLIRYVTTSESSERGE